MRGRVGVLVITHQGWDEKARFHFSLIIASCVTLDKLLILSESKFITSKRTVIISILLMPLLLF